LTDHNDDKPKEEDARPGALEIVLFSGVEVWVVLLLLLVGCLLAIGFGAAVLDAEREKGRFGSISQAALAVAEIPYTSKRLLSPNTPALVYSSQKYRSKPTGWSFPSGPMSGPDGYILLSRYDGTDKRHKIELVSLPAMLTVHSWTLNAAELLEDVTHVSRYAHYNNWNNARFREIHPWLEGNGDLIVKDHDSPLFRVDQCGKRLWTLQDAVYHHSTEADAEGNLWIPSVAERHSIANVKDSFWEDVISQVSPSGNLLYSRSVTQILLRHGYANWLFGMDVYNDDPTHLNDIQPVLSDGPYWKKGDLFLSLRNVSAIMLYRPSTDQIVWMKRGPWMSQHDVDILDDHRIGVYDNAVEDRGEKERFFASSSQVMVYDFATQKVSLPLEKAMKINNVRTLEGGLFTQLPDGSTMIEDETEARFLIFRADGRIAAEYVNRAKDGWIYHLGWSRYIDKANGDLILRNLRKVRCNA
jgi:hypothetical protein